MTTKVLPIPALIVSAIASVAVAGNQQVWQTTVAGGRSQGGPYTAESTVGEPYATIRCASGAIDLRLGYLAATESEWTIPCPADISNDGDVSVVDLLILLDAWGTNDPNADINNDGLVGTDDILAVLGAWGACP
ncbi:MAG: GC-type dockerin domain-anchored protein [Phycisphaerales bacterium]|jgi:hypothetical protein|nr:GC-type dockerin domain-anchored protein [Phycisphaerales bacterium]